jgi:GINS complex subunit 3
MSYYDVDAILTDGEVRSSPSLQSYAHADQRQKVPCTFELEVPYLGHLNNAPTQVLKPGTALTLPLWLAQLLALASSGDSSPPLTLNMPPCLGTTVLSALKADPRAVPLRDQSVHLYGVGVHMLDLFDERELGDVLRRTWTVRAGEVGLHARKADEGGLGGQQEEFLRGLEEWERKLFRRAHEGVKGAKEWTERVKK